ncbi:MAG: hypothetical protein KJN90_09845, partial [Gammaproteobacteria bacterium]|nr:hypothetical protein [Gammaproteobacteria bacterium]
MNKYAKAIVVVSSMLTAGTSLAQVNYDYAQVVEVRPIVQVVEVFTPEEQCWQEEYLVDRNYSGNRSNTPGILG